VKEMPTYSDRLELGVLLVNSRVPCISPQTGIALANAMEAAARLLAHLPPEFTGEHVSELSQYVRALDVVCAVAGAQQGAVIAQLKAYVDAVEEGPGGP
jgi:hypothetical protein